MVVYLSRGYEKVKSKYFWGNLGPVLDKLVSSTFDKKRMTPHSVFSPGFRVATVLFILMKTVKLLQSAGDVPNIIWVGFCKATVS